MTQKDVNVVFMPSGKRGAFPQGTDILHAARSLGVDLDSVCGGRGICGRCKVVCAQGEFPKHKLISHPDNLSARNRVEADYETKRRKPLGDRRLACQAKLLKDAVIDIPAASQVHQQIVRKQADDVSITLNPVVRLYYVQVGKPDMHDPAGDLRRLTRALHRDWGLDHLDIDANLLPDLQKTLREMDFCVTVAVHENRQIIALRPGFHDRVLGGAIDVGSTTIGVHLCDLATGEVIATQGAMNPQIRFGEDLMSRVSYIMMNPGGGKALTEAVREALNELLAKCAKQANASLGDILELTIVGNPIMHHLVLGISPIELGGAPFALATDASVSLPASEIGINLHRNARVYALPCIAGHVGADAAGAMLADKPYREQGFSLLVDVGTNAEIMLGNKDRMLACSSPTGPAFEGAQLSSGQRAAPGAIERVRLDRKTFKPSFKIIGHDEWLTSDTYKPGKRQADITGICGSGVIEAVAELFLTGIIKTDGLFDAKIAATCPYVVEDGRTHAFVLHEGDVSVRLTQNDIRQIQLAKAALYAGVQLLMDCLGIDKVDRIRMAGAFGNHIDVKYAMVLGLIPDCDLGQVQSAGNAAGNGARMALLDEQSRREIEEIVLKVEKIETAVEPKFQEHFVEAMALPHARHKFPNLEQVVSLPAPEPSSPDSDHRTRGRRARRRAPS